jgi:4-hydroxybenzoate polyprenyltransferase
MKHFLDKKVKKMDGWDLALTKWATAAAILFIITIWPAALSLALSINPWYFLIATIILAARPLYKLYIK